MKRILSCLLSLALLGSAHAREQSDLSGGISDASTLSVAVSVAVPVGVISAGGALVVVSATAVADGTVWVLERVSDGVRMSVRFVGKVAVAAGTICAVTVIASGTVLSDAGRAVAFIPNEVGQPLLYNERVTR